MTYPQQFSQQPAQVPGGFVQPGQYPAAPQQFGQPQYPQQFPAPQGYPQQQYAAPAAPPQQGAAGSLDAFYSQTSTGNGQALAFNQVGQYVDAVIARDVTNADVQQQTEMGSGKLKFFRDGSPMFVLVLPLLMPNGEPATHYVKGPSREALTEAMNKAGCPAGSAPKGGDRIRITLAKLAPTRLGSPRKDYSYEYARAEQAGSGMNTAQQFSQQPAQPAPQAPQGQAFVQAAAPEVAQVTAQQMAQFAQAMPQFAGQPAGVGPQPMPQAPMPGGFVQPQPEQVPTPGVAGPPAQGSFAPAGMTAEQAAAFQNLLGQAGQPGA